MAPQTESPREQEAVDLQKQNPMPRGADLEGKDILKYIEAKKAATKGTSDEQTWSSTVVKPREGFSQAAERIVPDSASVINATGQSLNGDFLQREVRAFAARKKFNMRMETGDAMELKAVEKKDSADGVPAGPYPVLLFDRKKGEELGADISAKSYQILLRDPPKDKAARDALYKFLERENPAYPVFDIEWQAKQSKKEVINVTRDSLRTLGEAAKKGDLWTVATEIYGPKLEALAGKNLAERYKNLRKGTWQQEIRRAAGNEDKIQDFIAYIKSASDESLGKRGFNKAALKVFKDKATAEFFSQEYDPMSADQQWFTAQWLLFQKKVEIEAAEEKVEQEQLTEKPRPEERTKRKVPREEEDEPDEPDLTESEKKKLEKIRVNYIRQIETIDPKFQHVEDKDIPRNLVDVNSRRLIEVSQPEILFKLTIPYSEVIQDFNQADGAIFIKEFYVVLDPSEYGRGDEKYMVNHVPLVTGLINTTRTTAVGWSAAPSKFPSGVLVAVPDKYKDRYRRDTHE